MKKILCVTLIGIMLCCITSCGNLDVELKEPIEQSRFVQIDKNGWFITVYDRTTKVQYAVSDGYYNMGTITCLVDAEGKPLLYKEAQDE